MDTCSISDIEPMYSPVNSFEHLNWDQLGLKTMESKIIHLVEDGQDSEFLDVEFYVGRDKVVMKSSKFLLSLRLEYFQEMFSRKLGTANDIPDEEDWNPEKEDAMEMQPISEPTVINYPLLDPAAFKRVLHFLCRGEPHDFSGKENDIDYVFEVKDIAHAIRHNQLVKDCQAVLNKVSFGTTEDAIRSIDLAFSNPIPDKMELTRCFAYIRRHGQQILRSVRFLSVDQQTIFKLLMLDLLKENELTIFNAALRWAKHQIGLKKTDISDAEGMALRKVLGNAINEIRFASMTAQQIVDVAKSTKLLTSDEVIDLVMLVNGMPCSPTPFKTNPRAAVTYYLTL